MADTWGALPIPAPVPAMGITTWAAAKPYLTGALVVPSPASGFVYKCTTPGTSGGAQPAFPVVLGNTVADNGVVWTCFATHITAGDDVPGDPCLQVLLSYLRTVISTTLSAAWNTPGVAPARPIVANTYPFDPGKYGFTENDLPAIYTWRDSDGETQWLADDYTLDKSRLVLLYVFEPHGNPEVMKARAPFCNALRKAITEAIENSRDPSWVVAGDPDATAATLGSLMPRWAGYFDLYVGKGKSGLLRVPGVNGAHEEFNTYELELVMRENQTRDISLYPQMIGLDATFNLAAVDQDPTPLEIGETIVGPFKAWTATTTTNGGTLRAPTRPIGFAYQALGLGGVTGTTEPVWPAILNATILDGTVLWTAAVAVDTSF